jgi:non-homologous end joining protein Ku
MSALHRASGEARDHVALKRVIDRRGRQCVDRNEDEYFDDIPAGKVTKDMLDLAKHIVQTKSGHFKPDKFEDHYEEALKELLRKKQAGQKIAPPKEQRPRMW